MVYQSIWETLENWENFQTLVKVGNRIKYSGSEGIKDKDVLGEADTPEVNLIVVSGTFNPHFSSSQVEATKVFQIGIATSDTRLLSSAALFPVEWEIFRAMQGWDQILKQLHWPEDSECPFVRSANLLETTTGLLTEIQTRALGIEGWAAFMTMEVVMSFLTEDIYPAKPDFNLGSI